MKNDELLHKWVNGNLSHEEFKVFKLRPEYDSLVELYKNTENLEAPSFDEDAMLSEILKLEKPAAKTVDLGKRNLISNWMKYAAAACVLLLATWFLWPSSELISYEIAKGERTEAKLPDGSSFVLNAESKLFYDPSSWKTSRTLDLEGEAFFEVEKGSTFKVNTPNGVVQVLGTEFNVRSRDDQLEVTCQSGKVAVLNLAGAKLDELNPGDAIRISSATVTEKWQVQNTQNSWVTGITSLKKVPLITALTELERQYNISIKSNNVDTQTVISGSFQHKDLNKALQTILGSMNVNFEIKGDVVELSKQ